MSAFCSLPSLSWNSTMETRSSCVDGTSATTSMVSEPGRSVTTPLTRLASDTVYLPGRTNAPAPPPRPPKCGHPLGIDSPPPPPPPPAAAARTATAAATAAAASTAAARAATAAARTAASARCPARADPK